MYECNECDWVGQKEETYHPKHDRSFLLCPLCLNTTFEHKENKWISVESAPRDGSEFWAYGEGEQFTCHFEDDVFCNIMGLPVTHWMPMPAPPKGT